MSDEIWADDKVQFARLITEICGVQDLDMERLCEETDLSGDEINEIIERAGSFWQATKESWFERQDKKHAEAVMLQKPVDAIATLALHPTLVRELTMEQVAELNARIVRHQWPNTDMIGVAWEASAQLIEGYASCVGDEEIREWSGAKRVALKALKETIRLARHMGVSVGEVFLRSPEMTLGDLGYQAWQICLECGPGDWGVVASMGGGLSHRGALFFYHLNDEGAEVETHWGFDLVIHDRSR